MGSMHTICTGQTNAEYRERHLDTMIRLALEMENAANRDGYETIREGSADLRVEEMCKAMEILERAKREAHRRSDADGRESHRPLYRVTSLALAILLITLTLLTAAIAASPRIRQSIGHVMMTWDQVKEEAQYEYALSAEGVDGQHMMPQWIPEGFVLTEADDSTNSFTWEAEGQRRITYRLMTQKTVHVAGSEGTEPEIITINGGETSRISADSRGNYYQDIMGVMGGTWFNLQTVNVDDATALRIVSSIGPE